jgi:hypothetical protein
LFYFIVEVVAASILVSVFATWIKLIPRYPKRKYALIQQAANTGFLTVLLILLFSLDIYPSWPLLFAIILFIVWLSVRLTNNIVQKRGESIAEPAMGEGKNETTSQH